jgi:hypothetical protein
MKNDLTQIKPGDVLSYMYDTGAFGYQSCFVKVLKVGKKKVQVRFCDVTDQPVSWKYLSYFSAKISEKEIAEIRAEGRSGI